jgi:methionine biosynthesis protein MetW
MLRVGREGIVTFPNFGFWKCRLQIALGRMPVTGHLPHSWYNTPNIHMCTIHDFEALCARDGIGIVERRTVDADHRQTVGARWLPNLLAEVALYRCRRGG